VPNSLGVGITCGGDCTEKYPYTRPVALQVTGGSGPTVTWSGCTPEQDHCVADMTVDRTVTATLTCPNHCFSTCYSTCLRPFLSSNPIICRLECQDQCAGCSN